MNHNITFGYYSKTVLVVNDGQTKLNMSSSVLASFNRHDIFVSEESDIVSWVQQHQPDLIVLDLPWSQLINRELITALKLDWLTRNIPIMVVVNSTTNELNSIEKLNYDACLVEPYSTVELDSKIHSLVSVSACELYGVAV